MLKKLFTLCNTLLEFFFRGNVQEVVIFLLKKCHPKASFAPDEAAALASMSGMH